MKWIEYLSIKFWHQKVSECARKCQKVSESTRMCQKVLEYAEKCQKDYAVD